MAQRNFLTRTLGHSRAALVLLCLLLCPATRANITVAIRGVDDAVKANVLVYLSFERYKKRTDLSADTIGRLHDRVEREVQSALRPFGYYEPSIHSDLTNVHKSDRNVPDPHRPPPPRADRSGRGAAPRPGSSRSVVHQDHGQTSAESRR